MIKSQKIKLAMTRPKNQVIRRYRDRYIKFHYTPTISCTVFRLYFNSMMAQNLRFPDAYFQFDEPVTRVDCGEFCAPYNEWGLPFCCDTRHAIPTAYPEEWEYLQANTDLWHLYQPKDARQAASLQRQLPENQVLIECLGHQFCQRNFRSFVCRSFPFFPYITRQGDFLGLSVYWEYEDRCWVISHLSQVQESFRSQAIASYADLFRVYPAELESFRRFSGLMRQVFGRRRRAIPLLHRNGQTYKVTPRNGRMRRISAERFPLLGLYKIAADLPFPGESG